MDFISPAEWGAEVDYDGWTDTPYIKDDVAIHYNGPAVPTWLDGVEAEMAYLRGVERYHKDIKGWRGVAYGYAVGASGTVYRLRGKNNYGAHQGDWDGDGISNNKEVIPILFILGENQDPTAEMWLGARALYQWLLTQDWTDRDLRVKGHKEIQPKPTACPGSFIMHGINQGWVKIPPPVPVWSEPGDPVVTDGDADAVFAYLGLTNTAAKVREAWALDALMRHDKRLGNLEG